MPLMSLDYHRTCRAAAVRQNLTSATLLLATTGFPVTLEQTGGYCMVLAVHLPNERLWVTFEGDASPELGMGYLVAVHEEDGQDDVVIGTNLTLDGLYSLVMEWGTR